MFRNLVQASVTATRRALQWNLKGMAPPSEQVLFTFASAEDFKLWDLYADSKHGGLTSASLEPSTDGTETGVLAGCLSVDLAENADPRIKRSGFAGIRTPEGEEKIEIDLEPFDTLAFRVKGDGRCYLSSIRTDNWVGGPSEEAGNTWQAFLFAPKDEWHEVKIPLSRYLPTWRGKVIDQQTAEMNPARVMGLGLAVAAEGGPSGALRGPGPFRLQIDWIKALRTP